LLIFSRQNKIQIKINNKHSLVWTELHNSSQKKETENRICDGTISQCLIRCDASVEVHCC
jgi:hypothetical protein